MKLNNIKDITDFIFVGKEFEELSHYDLLIINSDWAEEQLAKDMKKMLEKNIIVLMNLRHLPTSANFHQDIILHTQVVHQ